jgi:tRNA modification GTPase
VNGPPLAALLTPSGRGAIATIRVALVQASRPVVDAWPFRAVNGRPLSAQSVGRIVFGHWGSEPAEEVVVCALDDATLEIHCHGGDAAARRILRDLADAGCRVVASPQFLQQTESPLRAEVLRELCRATTLPTAAILWEQANGLFESAVRDVIAAAPANLPAAADRVRDWLAWADFGLHLTRPWRVVLAGRPNVGKSSLINAILGYTRCIVFDQPGTTRDVVSAQTAIDGWPIELSDTAGLRASADLLESAGIERARQTLETADLVVVLVDVSQPASAADRAILAEHRPAIVVAHKCDLPTYEGSDRWQRGETATWLRVSAKTGAGVEALVAAISRQLVPRVPPPDSLIPLTERQVALLKTALAAAERNDSARLVQSLGDLLAGMDAAAQPPNESPAS